jgi:hypothetical protein
MRKPAIIATTLALLFATPAAIGQSVYQRNPFPQTWTPGLGNTGLFAGPVTVLSTELNSLASGSVAASSVGGSSGLFNNTYTRQAVWARGVLTASTSAAVSTGGNISCWFLETLDGSTFESISAAPPRSPDIVFPAPASTLSSTTLLSQGLVRLPTLRFKVLCQNNFGQALTASGNTVVVAPLAVQN